MAGLVERVAVPPSAPDLADVAVAPAAEPHFAYNATKRAIDLFGATVMLVLALPLLLTVALLLQLASGSPIFFVQWRSGLAGRSFGCWKFRTMVEGAEARRGEVLAASRMDGPALKVDRDPRVTTLGRLLRKTSIDELPQLWNVLIGNMSLVGPRPLPIVENRYRGAQIQRLSVKPGLTCIWQVSGRSEISFDDWMAMDLEYVTSRSLFKDLALLVRTVPAVLSARGAM
jgi:lipopolysaccharide/colanic/teichoic acid biosynthesis glycosyltransferase